MKKMNRHWDVKARAFNRMTGKPAASKSRIEQVNSSNSLFEKCILPYEVKTAYESFWNELNPLSEHVVFVSQVTPV